MLYGEYNHTLDSKGRINFPAKMREELGASFVISVWTNNCLAVHTEQAWNAFCEKLRDMKYTDSGDVIRYIFSKAAYVEPDKQGRILIPQNLREAAGLKEDVTIIGTMDRAEIWDAERWMNRDKQFKEKTVAERFGELGL